MQALESTEIFIVIYIDGMNGVHYVHILSNGKVHKLNGRDLDQVSNAIFMLLYFQ